MRSSRLQRMQQVCFWVALLGGALGFLTSAGCQAIPALPSGSLWFLHPLLLLVGVACGWMFVLRTTEIDRERWQTVDDPLLTGGERDYAHKRAERERRRSGTAFFAAPLMLGYWMAYQVAGGGQRLAAAILPVVAILGGAAGLAGRLMLERRRRASKTGSQE